MISTKYASIIAVAAFVAGSFVASPELRAYAANTVGSADIINNSIQSVDIKDGEVKTDDIAPSAVGSLRIKDNDVKAQDIAPNAVGTSEVADGAIAYGDVSRNLIAVEHRADCNCGGTGWDPDGTSFLETIYDNRITLNSVVSVTVSGSGFVLCSTEIPFGGAAGVVCSKNISQGAVVSYAIFNNPVYG
jgi:hypothetical protein